MEWMQGLPKNWTSLQDEPGRIPDFFSLPKCERRLQTLDLFSGCGGLTLALHPWCRVIGYCEIHPQWRRILEARMKSGHLDDATIYNDITSLNPAVFAPKGYHIDMICAGFPCQNIANTGDKQGIKGSKTSLFLHVERIVKHIRPKYVLLENVAAIMSARMFSTLHHVLNFFSLNGYNAEWGVFEARHVGAPHRRNRWFLLAHRRDVGLQELRQLVPKVSPAEQKRMCGEWAEEPGVHERLLLHSEKDTTRRLQTMGNMVCVPQGRFAFQQLIHR
jgi:DNA (cytosine-5)-methyltransferase 1